MNRLLIICLLTGFITVKAYWIVAQVKEINWQQNCIQDRNCDAMELSIVLDSNSDEAGSAQSSWKLENALKNPEKSKLFVHWTEAPLLTNITLKTLLTSNDVLFKIPRPCDYSSALHIFSPTIKASAYNSPRTAWNEPEADVDKRQTIGLVGKCFHVIIEVRLYAHNCPWCISTANVDQANISTTVSNSLNQLAESPAVVALVLVLLFAMFVVIILCTINIQKRRKMHAYQQQYTSSNLSELAFNRGLHSMVSNIPMPPMLRPPLAPGEQIKCYKLAGNLHEPSICPYYETLDTHTLQKAPTSRLNNNSTETYDSAFEQSVGGSPNSSFSGQGLSDSGRSSPPLNQQIVRPKADYV